MTGGYHYSIHHRKHHPLNHNPALGIRSLQLPLPEAKIVCVVGKGVLLILLGIGRARIGNRPVVLTVLETVAIAAAAGIAGVLIGGLIC